MRRLLAGVLRSARKGVSVRAENELLRAQLAVLTARQQAPVRPQAPDRVVISQDVDATTAAMGIRVLKTPVRAPKANAFAERVIGTIRRECLDHVIPWNERHLRRILDEWVRHYNRGQTS